MASFLRWGSAERQSSAQVVGVPEPAVAFHGARAFHDENQPEPSVPRRLSLATLRKPRAAASVLAPPSMLAYAAWAVNAPGARTRPYAIHPKQTPISAAERPLDTVRGKRTGSSR
jgi:hypothetical protein